MFKAIDEIMRIQDASDLRKAFTQHVNWNKKYGTYDYLYFITTDGAVLSLKAAHENRRLLIDAIMGDHYGCGWRVDCLLTHLENPVGEPLLCDHLGIKIEPEVGEY